MSGGRPAPAVARWVVTCEHGGNRVPRRYRRYFAGAAEDLGSHRGWDIGALGLYRALATELADFGRASLTTRLLVDLNRSLHHRNLHSRWVREAPGYVRREIVERYYLPYRRDVERRIAAFLAAGSPVVHLSIHTFTPELDGRTRSADVGLLYDPGRACEKDFARRLRRSVLAESSSLEVRMNYPYRGVADGFTTHLRRRFPAGYAGVELEVSQRSFEAGGTDVVGPLRRALLRERGDRVTGPRSRRRGSRSRRR